MVNVLDISNRYGNEWVVFDKVYRVLDHGPELTELWFRYGGLNRGLTFYFAAGAAF